jgi:hypothetical protein
MGEEGREVKRRSVCCNRDIVKIRTEVLEDWVPEFETRAAQQSNSLKANCSPCRLAGSVEEGVRRRWHSQRRPTAVVCTVTTN